MSGYFYSITHVSRILYSLVLLADLCFASLALLPLLLQHLLLLQRPNWLGFPSARLLLLLLPLLLLSLLLLAHLIPTETFPTLLQASQPLQRLKLRALGIEGGQEVVKVL